MELWNEIIQVGKSDKAVSFYAALVMGLIYTTSQKGKCNSNSIQSGALFEESANIAVDFELSALLGRLQVYESVSPKSFRYAVRNIDRLIYLRCQLQQTEPAMSDRPQAFKYFQRSLYYLDDMVQCSKKNSVPYVPVMVHSIYLKIYTNLEAHWCSILQDTNRITLTYAHPGNGTE